MDEVRDNQMIKMLRKSCALIKDNELLPSPWARNDFQEILLSEKGRVEKHIA